MASSGEARGFAIFCISAVAYAAYVGWLLVPASTLSRVFGLTAVPSQYWAVALPGFVCGAVLLVVALYIGVNMATTPPFASYRSYRDTDPADCTAARMRRDGEGAAAGGAAKGYERTPPIADVPLAAVSAAVPGSVS